MKKLIFLFILLSSNLYAGRDFDGTDDEISFGSDASVDAFTRRTISVWARIDTTGTVRCIATKGAGTNEALFSAGGNVARYISDWTTDGNWVGTATIADATFKHLCVNYNNNATTNDPIFYVNGAVDAFTTDTNPTGSWVSDAGNNLQIGETNADALDLDGILAFFTYDSTIFSAADCNRAKYWGRAKGGLVVYHPLMTDKLANEGSGTADGTATGTTVVSAPVPVQRPSSALLNGGIGW